MQPGLNPESRADDFYNYLFVYFEIIQSSQLFWVMSSAVILPNHVGLVF